MAGRRIRMSGAVGGAGHAGKGAAAGHRGRGRAPEASPDCYFFWKTPVCLVPPQKTLVPNLSLRPVPAHVRQRRYPPL